VLTCCTLYCLCENTWEIDWMIAVPICPVCQVMTRSSKNGTPNHLTAARSSYPPSQTYSSFRRHLRTPLSDSVSLSCPLAAPIMRPDSLLRLWRSLTYLLCKEIFMWLAFSYASLKMDPEVEILLIIQPFCDKLRRFVVWWCRLDTCAAWKPTDKEMFTRYYLCEQKLCQSLVE